MARPELSAPPGPALGSTADEAPYVPVSWLAVVAAAAAGLFAFLLLVMGIIAVRSKRPLLEEELLVLPIIAVVLSFAARRVIRNSEGTRTGQLFSIDLPNTAWWGGLVLGLGYVSYLLAIEYSIRKDAQSEVQQWTEWLSKGDDESINRAFHRTQDPSQRKNTSPTKGELLEARWGKEYVAFGQSDLRRLILRNATNHKIELGGLRDWKYQPTGIECVYAATLTCPEGTFPLLIQMKGTDAGAAGTDSGARQWQIMHYPSSGYIEKDRARLTPYGWFVAQMGITGAEQGRRLATASVQRESRAGIRYEFADTEPGERDFYRPLTLAGAQARSSVVGVAAAYAFSPGRSFLDASAAKLYTLPGGAPPDAARLETFRKAWFETGIVRAGERLQGSTDTNDQVWFADDAVYYRMPVEIPLSATRGEMVAARAGAVFKCDDPAILEEAKRLRAAADPAVGSDQPDAAAFAARKIVWKLARIESDMKPIKAEPPKQPNAPAAPPVE
ncbi:MAG: hypothetical protein U0791_18345 [Gemmataceae bacterium]